jgi:hypothetical protein
MTTSGLLGLPIPEQAALVRRGLNYGYVTAEEAVAWADQHIQAMPSVPDALLDVSLSTRKDRVDIADLLRDISLPFENVLVKEHVQFMRSTLERCPERAEKIAWAGRDMALSRAFGRDAPDAELLALAYEFDPNEAEFVSSHEDATTWLNEALARVSEWLAAAV